MYEIQAILSLEEQGHSGKSRLEPALSVSRAFTAKVCNGGPVVLLLWITGLVASLQAR